MFLFQIEANHLKRSRVSRAWLKRITFATLASGTLACTSPSKGPEVAPTRPKPAGPVHSTESEPEAKPGKSTAAPTPSEAPKKDDGVPAAPLTAPSRAEAEAEWRNFVSAWNSRDPKKTALWDPSRALILIDNPGAFTRLRSTTGIGKLAELEGEFDGARVKVVNLDATLEAAEAPSIDCGAEIPDRGNFVAKPERMRLELRWEALSKYELASVEEIQALEGPVRHATATAWFTVYDIRQNVGFLFGREGERTVLLAIDAVFPCSA